MDGLKDDKPFFKVLIKCKNRDHLYRRGVILSEIQSPSCPLVSKTILPDPLTIDTISQIQKKPFLSVSYSSVLPCLPMLQEYEEQSKSNKHLRRFVDYEGAITLFNLNNPFIEEHKIENGNFVFYVNSSKYQLDLHTTKLIINLLRPAMSIIPCELMKMNKLTKLSSRKRNRAIEQYTTYHEELKESCGLTKLIASLHPVLDYDKDDIIPGVELSGLGYGESLEERAELIKSMLKRTNEEKLRVLQLNTGTPLEILHAVVLGVDVIITPHPETLSRGGRGLCFNIPNEIEGDIDLESLLHLLNENCKFEDGVYIDNINSFIDLNDSVYHNQVNERLYENSIRKESRSYVHHLLKCKEMSAEIILSSHNLWMYEALFRKIRDSIEKDNLLSFVNSFIKSNVK
ncbi:queuine tRNA-ribosyltransferase-like protein [Theileria orientalis]|uniref:Queuine tRNA-ribosyltransferase-like protein n=1 Tax=Theileria orientalis TaxID=68886 RepID=A0A976M5B3_THEOR|nr:queuine tRNA-ribosyltransferase-like protein [Theileria orientalis]